jgi:hypothetical protein
VTLDAGSPFSGSSSVLSALVRGIGQSDFAANFDPGVGVYLDGVYLAAPWAPISICPMCSASKCSRGRRVRCLAATRSAARFDRHARSGNITSFRGDITTGRYNRLDMNERRLPMSDRFAR